jgi:hypothetical protein
MSRAALEAALARAEANVAEAGRRIVREKVHILEMGSLGLDVVRTKERLALLEETQRLQFPTVIDCRGNSTSVPASALLNMIASPTIRAYPGRLPESHDTDPGSGMT